MDPTAESTCTSTTASTRKRNYTVAFKLKVVEYTQDHSKRETSKMFGIDRKRVQDWCKQKEDLCGAGRSAKRLKGGGAKPLFTPIEEQLVQFIRSKREEKKRVTRKSLKEAAVKLHRAAGNYSFSGSDGWLGRFMARNRISLRRRTTGELIILFALLMYVMFNACAYYIQFLNIYLLIWCQEL